MDKERFKQIVVKRATYDKLKDQGRAEDSFDHVISKLIKEFEDESASV